MCAGDLDSVVRQQAEVLPTEAINPFRELRALLETPLERSALNLDSPKANLLTQAYGGRGLAVYLALDEQPGVYIVRIDSLSTGGIPPVPALRVKVSRELSSALRLRDLHPQDGATYCTSSRLVKCV